MYPFSQNQYNPYSQQLLRVNGLEGAKSYQTYPGSTVALFDNSEDIMYIKSLDQCGFPTIRTFRFEEIKPQTMPSGNFVSREEMEQYVKQLVQQYATSESNKDATV